jgi:hypothetical protein
MAAYHLKRTFRNRLCLHLPSAYERHIERITSKVPHLMPSCQGSLGLARTISLFYADEYRDYTDDAAKGIFTLFGERVDFGSVDNINWHYKISDEKDFHLWRMKLCHMGFVCPMLIDGKDHHLQTVGKIISGYRDYAKFDVPDCFSSYWFPYSVSHRVLAIMSGYIIASVQGTLSQSLKQQVEEFLRWNIGFILANIEHELKNNHVERNLAAICLYYNCVETLPVKLIKKINKDVNDIISACILEDGMLAERSAMYQGLSVMALHVFSETRFLSEETRGLAKQMLPKAIRAWNIMTHPDGEISLFNDSWLEEVPKAGHVTPAQNFSSVEALQYAGYVRLQYGDFFILFDAGDIGPVWNPGHGHADFLSIELDVAGVRFIVDPGTFQYSTGWRRHFERSAQSHNGPCWGQIEPVEYHGCFKVGKMAKAQINTVSGSREVGLVVGELVLAQGAIRRKISASDEGVFFTDTWKQGGDNAIVRLIVQGQWVLVSRTEKRVIFQCGNTQVSLVVKYGVITNVEPNKWARRYLQSEDATVVYLEPDQHEVDTKHLIWQVVKANGSFSNF